jgi:cytochrome P450
MKDDGRRLKKGTDLMILIDGVHKNPKFHANPLQFNPERFSQEALRQMDPYSYMPFSQGPRNCIGKRSIKFTNALRNSCILIYNHNVLL